MLSVCDTQEASRLHAQQNQRAESELCTAVEVWTEAVEATLCAFVQAERGTVEGLAQQQKSRPQQYTICAQCSVLKHGVLHGGISSRFSVQSNCPSTCPDSMSGLWRIALLHSTNPELIVPRPASVPGGSSAARPAPH